MHHDFFVYSTINYNYHYNYNYNDELQLFFKNIYNWGLYIGVNIKM